MIANYHTHTARCLHAMGADEAYAQRALEGGLQILGFSDHTPYPFPDGYYSKMRMYPHQLQEYADSVLGLREAYAGKMDIRLGLEAEYYPAFFGELIQMLKDSPVEYLLLGQHWSGNEIGETHNARPTDDETVLRRYCTQVAEAMQTGLFTYLAHPDMLQFTGDDKVYEKHMRTLCREAKGCDIPLEINLLGLRENRHYPRPRFWELAAEERCNVILGCDAHSPIHAWDPETEQRALELVASCDLKLLHTVPLRPIK